MPFTGRLVGEHHVKTITPCNLEKRETRTEAKPSSPKAQTSDLQTHNQEQGTRNKEPGNKEPGTRN